MAAIFSRLLVRARAILIGLVLGVISSVLLFRYSSANAPDDLVCDWNNTTTQLTGQEFTNYATRIDAIESIAVYNAVAAVDRCGSQYRDDLTVEGPASAEAAAAV